MDRDDPALAYNGAKVGFTRMARALPSVMREGEAYLGAAKYAGLLDRCVARARRHRAMNLVQTGKEADR